MSFSPCRKRSSIVLMSLVNSPMAALLGAETTLPRGARGISVDSTWAMELRSASLHALSLFSWNFLPKKAWRSALCLTPDIRHAPYLIQRAAALHGCLWMIMGGKKFLRFERCHAAQSGGGEGLPVNIIGHVAGRKDARHRCDS